MACNCKKKIVLEDTYGTREQESLFMKLNRYVWRAVMFPIMLIMACVLVPVIVFSIVYQMVFKSKVNVVLPKFLAKYLK